MHRLRTLSLRARDSFWFWPTVLGVLAIALAEGLVSFDQALRSSGVHIAFLDALSASGGRSILTTVGTSMLTVAGTSFSIVISVLATTTSTYGPRLVRNFMADRGNQLVLAAFTATFLYCITVLRSVHTAIEDSDAFVPVIAVHVAVLGGIVDVGVLVYFIHHVAKSVEVTTLQRRVQLDLQAALAHAYTDGSDDSVTSEEVTVPGRRTAVLATTDGYVQSFSAERLRELADRHDVAVRIVAMPGRHVIPGEPLAEVIGAAAPDPAESAVRDQFVIGADRTPYQDVDFALQQLVEIAVRGLASGSNDPYTAATALELAAAPLVPLWRDGRSVTALLDEAGSPVVLLGWPDPAELLDRVFDGVSTYGRGHPIVIDAACRLAARLGAAAPHRRDHTDRWQERLRTRSGA